MKTSHYTQLTLSERREIDHFIFEKKYSIRKTAHLLQRNASTISREIRRNFCSRLHIYAPKRAHWKKYVRKKYCKYQKTKILNDMKLKEYITHHLKLGWSPEEISGRIGSEIGFQRIGKSSIYNYLRSAHGQLLAMDLELEKIKKRKKKEKIQAEGAMRLEDRIFIDKRPTSIDERLHFGDWEGDFIVSPKGKKGSLVVLHERKSRFVMIRKIETRSIHEVHETIHRMLRIIQTCSSLTLDNDIAFRRHQELSEIIKAPIYFCHAYHSWEKGGVEFSNRLIREYIPKGTEISKVDEDYILNLEVALNNRPRKILGFKTPLEVMQENEQFTTFTDYPCETWRDL